MRERLKLMNGVFSIDSQRERGTKIRASVPLREWFRLRGLRMKHPNLRTKQYRFSQVSAVQLPPQQILRCHNPNKNELRKYHTMGLSMFFSP